ncbi:DNA topoisomerase II large subunit [Bacillus phage G]|uniref:DNA topoisomerase (ATP-hydrolyzing) n=1 Tax=Bacillus phage G TaxID=2884420 RepID=G3M9Z3_9CAUD|nr:DNA topoisomerase II large subunit [Bacillus phage G]AEO93511.1 gp252 [Bacillus phage G]
MSSEKDNLTVNTDYGVEQIDALEGLEAVRKRPGMYIGTTTQKGVTHLVWEAADNSIDESVAGFGSEVWISVETDGTTTIKDKGRGIPVGPHPKFKNADGTQKDTLTVVCTQLHAGGKFNQAGSAYKSSAGLHGVGIKTITALSDHMVVEVRRNGKIHRQEFSRCYPVTEVEVIGECDINDTGTTVQYHPDAEIFKQTLLPDCKSLQARMAELASLNAGLRIYYTNESTGHIEDYYYEDGLIGYVNRMVGEKPSLYDKVLYFKDTYDVDENRQIIVEIAFRHDDDDKAGETIKSFANNINTHEGGFHYDGFRKAYRKFLNKYGEDKGLLKAALPMGYLLEGINAVVSVKVPEAEFEGQTKTKLGNAEAEDAVIAVFEKGISEFSKDPEADEILETIILKSIRAKEADEAARKARQLVKQGKKAKKLALPGKLADCTSKTYSELYIVEGDSAGGSAKSGRNRYYQAILSLRGKILNVEKSSLERMLNSEMIKNIIGAVGTGIDSPGQKFEYEKLRYDKIIFMCDADVDGSHIEALLLTLFYNYMRPLIEKGHVYAAQPPLYRVVKKNESIYLKDDHELKEYTKKHPNAEVQRFKGLGEMNADQLWETTMDPKERTLLQITLEDAERASTVFSELMGGDAKPRRDFIEANAHKVDLSFT